MTGRRGGAWRTAVVLALAAALCTACSGASGPAAAGSRAAETVPSSPAPTPSSSRVSPAPLPTFDRTATPATSSGSLRRASLPKASILGAGWSTRADPGAAEDGYTGNGTPAVARDPADTVVALRPIGCAEESVYAVPLPVPKHALEVDYRHRPSGANGVGLALEFADATTAAVFFGVYTDSLSLCRSGADGTTRVSVQGPPGAAALATITVDPIEGSTWRELAEVSGRVVRLLAVEGGGTPVRAWSRVLSDLRGG